MDDQNHNHGTAPQLRQTLSATFERLRLQALAFRPRRSRLETSLPLEQDEFGHGTWIGTPLPATTRSQTLTCAHISHAWFAQPSSTDEDVDTKSARATLKELLTESVIFGRISAFYPPPPPPNVAKQSVIRDQLLTAFDSSTQPNGGSSSRRAPTHTREAHFTRFPDLPAEIRLQIWVAALPGPGHRTLHIGQKVGEPYSWTARLPMPTLSRVCRESRDVVLKTVFPVYGHAPYMSGPGASHSLTRRFVTSWASSNDCLDFGATSCPAALRCGDYLERARDFRAAAQGLTSIRPSGMDNETSGGGQSGGIAEGVKQLMVVIQVLYITLPTPPSSSYLPCSSTRSYHDSFPQLLDETIRVCKVSDVTDAVPFDWNLYDSSAYRRPREHHITTVANLHDRTRIKELLALGSAIGDWTDHLSRLRALHYHSNAFCMDCLLEWWEKYALGEAQQALLKANPPPLSDDVPEPGGLLDALPELIPAVRFKIQWPGLEEHAPTFSYH